MKRFNSTLAAAILGLACAGGQAEAAEMLNQAGYGFGYGNIGNGMGFGYGGLGYGPGMRGYAGPMFAGYGGWGGYGAGYAGWGYGPGGRHFGAHHGWNHGGFGGYGGCGGGVNSNWDGYCNQCGGDSCGHVKVWRRCRPLGCGAGPYVDPNCGCQAESCNPCGHRRCGLFHRHRRFAACCVDACCDGGYDGMTSYDMGDDTSVQSQGDSEELQAPPPAGDEKPMPLPPEGDAT